MIPERTQTNFPFAERIGRFQQYINYLEPAYFIRLLLLDHKRSKRTGANVFVLKISCRSVSDFHRRHLLALQQRAAYLLYLNIRQADYWSENQGIFYLALINCNLNEALQCKQRLETIFASSFPGPSSHSFHFELISLEQSIKELQPLPGAEEGNEVSNSNKTFLPKKNSWIARFWQPLLRRLVIPLIVHGGFTLRQALSYSYGKRLLDIFLSLFLLLLCLPAFMVISAAIFIEDPGPIFFRQRRVGFMGKTFILYKFRTMRMDKSNHKDHEKLVAKILQAPGNGHQKQLEEEYRRHILSRTTRVGRVLRKTSLDELPQLWNVLRNEMTLVGPRPHPEYEVRRYRKWYRERLLAKPGLTGLSKVEMRFSPQNYEQSIRLDIRYLRNWSLLQDLKILAKTVKVLVVPYE